MGSKQFIRREIWGLNEEQIEQLDDQRLKEKKVDSLIEAAGTPGMGAEGGEGAAGGADDLFGGGGGGADAAPPADGAPEATPPEENAGEKPEEEEPGGRALLTGGDDPADDEDFALRLRDLQDKPITVKTQLDRVLYNRGRRRTHGASKTHLPDFVKMTSGTGRSMDDPYDSEWINAVVSNPFGESHDARPRKPLRLSVDVTSALRKMTTALGLRSSEGVLSEGKDVQEEIDAGTSGELDLELVDVASPSSVLTDDSED